MNDEMLNKMSLMRVEIPESEKFKAVCLGCAAEEDPALCFSLPSCSINGTWFIFKNKAAE